MAQTPININKKTMGKYESVLLYTEVANKPPVRSTSSYDRERFSVVHKKLPASTPWYGTPQQGDLKALPYNFELEVFSHMQGSEVATTPNKRITDYGWYYKVSTGYTDVVWSSSKYATATPAEIETIKRRANLKLLNKIKGMKINLAQLYAEKKQVSDLILSTVTNVAGAVTNLRRGNFSAAARNLGLNASRRQRSRFNKAYKENPTRAVSSGWLQLQYGWVPLFSDIHGACETLAQLHDSRVQKKAHVKQSILRGLDSRVVTKNGDQTTIESTGGQMKVSCNMGVTYVTPNKATSALANLGLTNPALIAWEIMPFSFVADWWFPIGGFLSALDATTGLEFLDGYTTIYEETNFTREKVVAGTDRYGVQVHAMFSGYASKHKMTRTIMSSFPSPVIPAYNDNFSMLHTLNGLALIQTIFRK